MSNDTSTLRLWLRSALTLSQKEIKQWQERQLQMELLKSAEN